MPVVVDIQCEEEMVMGKFSQIVPAILTDDPESLETMIRQAETFTNYVQFDIMDGRFVPSCSVGCEDIAALSTKLNWEVHLMVQQPEKYLECFQKAGAKKVTFHFESTLLPEDIISQARRLGLSVGLAINPDTPVSAILPLVDEVDSVLFLTVHPGFYGSQFVPGVMDKIAQFHSTMPHVKIGVDGGIKENNIARIAQIGVDFICVGSAIFLQTDPAASYRRLAALAQKASPILDR